MALKQLVEKRNELQAKNKKLAKIFEEAKGDPTGNSQDIDLSLIKSIDGDAKSKLDAIRKLSDEVNDLGQQVDELARVEKAAAAVAQQEATRLHDPEDGKTYRPTQERFPQEDNGRIKGFGDLFVESEAYKAHQPGSSWKGLKQDFKSGLSSVLLKTTFSTSAGWAPESLRTGRLVEEALQPIDVLDAIPSGRTGQAAVVWMEETTVTNNADTRNEAAAYAESALALTEQSATVRSIGTSLPITDEQLEDVPQVQSYLNMRLPYLVRKVLQDQILTGSGVAPDLTGINNFSGIQTQALGTDPVPDAIYKAMTKVMVTGRANANIVVLHPNDWQAVRLLRTSDGIYIWGNPSEAGPMRIWGRVVIPTTAQTENTGLVGDSTFVQLFIRRDVMVEIGLDSDDFTKGIQTLRAGVRAVLCGYRDAAWCQVTGV